jgi:DNA-binding transcriptional regulator YhcF (GntR family)
MRLSLDPKSPVPLYHQISESIRYRIATGDLEAGDPLPALRDAARDWGVNLHTVRRAYAELARLGVVTTRAPLGTRVLRAETNGRARRTSTTKERERFVSAVVREARLRHGLDVGDLVRLLGRAQTPRAADLAVSVVECSRTQTADLASQVEEAFDVEAIPWSLEKAGAPPDGLVVATYFHYNEVRRRWPDRLEDVRFLPIAPEPGLAERIGSARHRSKRTVVLLEREENMARNIAADLSRVLPQDRFRVVTKVVADPSKYLDRAGDRSLVLLSPRVWGEVPERFRERPHVRQVRYVFDPKDLDALAAEQGWEVKS